jgi:hypothetical protein
MSEIARKFGRRRRVSLASLPWRVLCLSLLLLAFSHAANASGRPDQLAPVDARGRGLPFAIGDFDGDLRPDIASIHPGHNGCSNGDYWVEIQLTSAARQSFRVVAPLGGLQIEARDVNGDDALDLVISTAWLRQPVSILLNDGRGHFSAVDPSAFSTKLRESGRTWAPTTGQAAQAAAISPRWRSGDASQTNRMARSRTQTSLICPASSEKHSGVFCTIHQGRAPPSLSRQL